MPVKLIAKYLRWLADRLDPPQALQLRITCDPSQAIASLESLRSAFQKMLDSLDWEVKCNK